MGFCSFVCCSTRARTPLDNLKRLPEGPANGFEFISISQQAEEMAMDSDEVLTLLGGLPGIGVVSVSSQAFSNKSYQIGVVFV